MREVTFDRPIQTVKAISEAASVSRITLAQACQRGILKEDAYQSGSTWLIDTHGGCFRQWLAAHWQQPRVKGTRGEQESEKRDADRRRKETPTED